MVDAIRRVLRVRLPLAGRDSEDAGGSARPLERIQHWLTRGLTAGKDRHLKNLLDMHQTKADKKFMALIPKGKRKAAKSASTSPRKAPVAVKATVFFPHSPSVTVEVWEEILLDLADGQGLRKICREHPEFPARSAILRAVALGTKEQQDHYARACEDGADAMIEDATDIADETSHDTITKVGRDGSEYDVANTEWISRSKLRVEQRRWHASKLKPKKYGDKVDVTSDGKALAGQAARTEVDALLARADELRRRSRGL